MFLPKQPTIVMKLPQLHIKTTFQDELPADVNEKNTRRQVEHACFSYVFPKSTANPNPIHIETDFAKELGFSTEEMNSKDFLNLITGNDSLDNYKPFAMCYGGHQFGNWAGQLGDGRAINIAEIDSKGKSWYLQLKGAGETPYSRTADGLAVLRSSVREYICSEAMYHLGIPTTRALSLALSGDEVLRDILYNGNPAYEKGAIVCRVSESFLRFGNYEIFAARNDKKTLKTLVDFTIKHHYPHLGEPSKETYLQFFKEVSQRTQKLIIDWQRVGFVHGVMNTDNMSILGQTIDYGPYGWLEGYDPNWTPNTTDNQHRRYRFGQQGNIGLWNLLQLANALFPLIEDPKPLENILSEYHQTYDGAYLQMMRSKLGLVEILDEDETLIKGLEHVLQLTETDMTICFRALSQIKSSDTPEVCLECIQDAFYVLSELTDVITDKWKAWFILYLDRLQKESIDDVSRQQQMNKVNPKYVFRNYMAQMATDLANKGDFSLIEEFSKLFKNPYNEQPEYEKWYAKRPEWARHKIGCSQLSCSS